MSLDSFAKQHDLAFVEKKTLQASVAELRTRNAGLEALLAKPQTFMNASGEAIQKLLHFYKINPSDLLVIHDEIDLSFGTLRIRSGGSSAGHNGLESIIRVISPRFYRGRVGIANEHKDQTDAAEFVLSNFNKDEAARLPIIFNNLSQLIQSFIEGNALNSQTQTIKINN